MRIDGNTLYMANISQMHVKQHYFDLLEAGVKAVEFRVNDEKRRSIKVGDKIRFVCQNDDTRHVDLAVSDIVLSSGFESLIKRINPDLLGGIAPQQQLKELKNIYDSDSVKRYGVVALLLEGAA